MKIGLPKGATTQLDKMKQTRSMTLGIISVASIIVVFCLMASKTLLSEASHQRRVINGSHAAINQLKADISAVNTLSTQYQALNNASTNIIGGSSTGTGPNDGNNPQIILDALPSQYDFPGLTASVQKIIANRNIVLNSITGVDDESANIPNAVPNPKPVVMTFSFSASTGYTGVQQLFRDFGRSIRPFHVVSLQLVGTDAHMTVNASINTYFQPAKSVSITQKGVQ